MIIYEGSKERFVNEAMNSTLSSILFNKFRELGINGGSSKEQQAWNNSLIRVAAVIMDDDIPANSKVAIEYRIPTTAKRIDFMIAGEDSEGRTNVILLELKQWEEADLSDCPDCVVSLINGAKRTLQHPAAQVYNYAMLLENLNQDVKSQSINLFPAAYLHNYKETKRSVLFDPRYQFYFSKVPMFLSSSKDRQALKEEIKKHIVKPPKVDPFEVIEHGKLKPSKALQDSILGLLECNEAFYLLDEQQVAYSTVYQKVKEARGSNKKSVIIVQGGPGTGKSVIAVSLLANLLHDGYSAAYVTKNSAPRYTFGKQLTEGHKSQAYIKQLFKSSQSFLNEKENRFDCLLVDEAHRLGDKSNYFDTTGIDQARRIIRAAQVTVLFVDEDQRITTKDQGSLAQLRLDAQEEGAAIIEGEDLILKSQFRCNGSDGYIAWIKNALGIEETANELFDLEGYDLRLYSDAFKMKEDLKALNSNNKARMLAGYTYEWASKNDPNAYDIILPNGFKAQWNFTTDSWATDVTSFDQVGCIFSSQGLEFDYVGVIIGLDLVVRNNVVVADPTKNAKSDKTTFVPKSTKEGPSKLGDMIIKNTYKTLLTRGQKGCFIYCEDMGLAKRLVTLGAKQY